MNLYDVQVTYKNADSGKSPLRYRGIVGATDEEAISKAGDRHQRAGHKFVGATFKVVSAKLILCPTEVESAL